jgi:hypothetical protein
MNIIIDILCIILAVMFLPILFIFMIGALIIKYQSDKEEYERRQKEKK